MPDAHSPPPPVPTAAAADTVSLGEWTYGNRVCVLENGEAYFPAVFTAIACARRQVLVETFILFDDAVGRELRAVLIDAARRGLRVALTVDGYGSPDLSAAFLGGLIEAGVDVRSFDPRPRVLGVRFHVFRRLHRKIVVVDDDCAFVGGLNFSIEHMQRFGVESKQDYAVRVEGPAVAHVRRLAELALAGRDPPRARPWWRGRVRLPASQQAAGSAVRLVWRDNAHHRDDIELHYRMAIRRARHEVLIANAYFFPSYRMVRELRGAARRGVRVCLVLQGRSDHAVMTWGARSLYAYLMAAGVEIHEYCERALHGKIAVVDDRWSTVGSSNLDPASLGLNLEANLVFDDAALATTLRGHIERLMHEHLCQRIRPDLPPPPRPLWGRLMWTTAFHLMRMMPGWGHWFPVLRRQQLRAMAVVGSRVQPRDAARRAG